MILRLSGMTSMANRYTRHMNCRIPESTASAIRSFAASNRIGESEAIRRLLASAIESRIACDDETSGDGKPRATRTGGRKRESPVS